METGIADPSADCMYGTGSTPRQQTISLIWSAPAKPVRFVCIEPWQSLPGAENDPQAWTERAAAACLAPGQHWATTLSTTFER